jgi:hypothetical protein
MITPMTMRAAVRPAWEDLGDSVVDIVASWFGPPERLVRAPTRRFEGMSPRYGARVNCRSRAAARSLGG